MKARTSATIPPHSLEAERAVLGSIFLEPAALSQAAGRLTADDLYKEGHRIIYKAMLDLAERNEPIDLLTLQAELQRRDQLEAVGGPAALAVLMEDGAMSLQVPSYVTTLQDLSAKREVIRLAREAQNGLGREELVRALDALVTRLAPSLAAGQRPPEVIDAAVLLERDYPDTAGVVQGLIEDRSLTIIGGSAKLGKTALLLGLLLTRSAGAPWLGRATRRGRSGYFQAELSEPLLKQRLALMIQEAPGPLVLDQLLTLSDRNLTLDTPEGQRRIRALIERHRDGLDVVSFDPLARFMAGRENSTEDMNRVVAFLDALIQDYSLAVIAVHHTAKPQRDDPKTGGDKLRGSSVLFAAADSVLMLERQRGGPFTLSFQLRHAAEPEPLILSRGDTLWFQPDEAPEDLQAVANLAGEGRRFSELLQDLQEIQGVSRATAARLLDRAKKLGLVAHEGGRYRSQGLTTVSREHETEDNSP